MKTKRTTMDILDHVLGNLMCIATGIFVAEHTGTRIQQAIVLPSLLLLGIALFIRWRSSAKEFKQALERYRELTEALQRRDG